MIWRRAYNILFSTNVTNCYHTDAIVAFVVVNGNKDEQYTYQIV